MPGSADYSEVSGNTFIVKAAGGNIYISNDSGSVAIMAPGIEQKILAVNMIDGRSGATPVFEGTKLFLRVGEEIYCIGK